MKIEIRDAIRQRPIKFLEKANIATILLILNSEGPMVKTALYNKIGKGATAPQGRVKELIELGLVEEEEVRSPVKMKVLSITEKGRKIAKKLEEIQEMLEG